MLVTLDEVNLYSSIPSFTVPSVTGLDDNSGAAIIDVPTRTISSSSGSETDLVRRQPIDLPISSRRHDQANFFHQRMENVALRSDEFSSVNNVSQRQLSDGELGFLSRGLSFCPVPNDDGLNLI